MVNDDGYLIWLMMVNNNMVGGFNLPLWKMMEWKSVGMMTFGRYGKIEFMFQTTTFHFPSDGPAHGSERGPFCSQQAQFEPPASLWKAVHTAIPRDLVASGRCFKAVAPRWHGAWHFPRIHLSACASPVSLQQIDALGTNPRMLSPIGRHCASPMCCPDHFQKYFKLRLNHLVLCWKSYFSGSR